jgi:hypothetical protein
MPLEPLKSYFIGDLTFNLDYETSNKKPNGGAIVVGAALGGVVGAIVAKEITSEHNVDKPEYQICPKIDSLSLYEHDYLKIRYPHITEIIYNPVVCQ